MHIAVTFLRKEQNAQRVALETVRSLVDVLFT